MRRSGIKGGVVGVLMSGVLMLSAQVRADVYANNHQEVKRENRSLQKGSVSKAESQKSIDEVLDEEAQGSVHGHDGPFDFSKFKFFGYGEMHFNNRIGAGDNEIDFHRLVLGVGYDFTDRIKLRTEVDFEHAFTEPELEYAYLDFLFKPSLNVRAGAVLMPMGVINQNHEPPTFNSVERPELYRVIIPTTWQEGGAGLFGKLPMGFDYQLYGVTMPTALGDTDATSFSGSNGIRGGRGKLAEAKASDWGVTGRIQNTALPGLRLGTSFLIGNTGQGNDAISDGTLTMVEGDAKFSHSGFDLEGVVAFNHLSDAANINSALLARTPAFTNFVASQMLGWYVEGAYHVFHHLWPETKHDLIVFTRFEDFNTQHKMPAGSAANSANDRNTWTSGISYLPIPNVAIKADYMANWNKANSGVDQFNMGIGFYY